MDVSAKHLVVGGVYGGFGVAGHSREGVQGRIFSSPSL